jgi:hypothetical protein
VLWVWLRLVLYNRVFSPGSFADFARVLARLKAAALGNVESGGSRGEPRADDPRRGITAAGILVYYAIYRDGGAFVHHLSLSLGGRYTSAAVGRTFAAAAAALLGVPAGALAVERSENTVYHLRFGLTAAGHEEFAAVPVAVPGPEEARRLHREWAAAGRQLRVGEVNVAALARDQARSRRG